MVKLLVLWAVKQLYGLTMVSIGGEATIWKYTLRFLLDSFREYPIYLINVLTY